MKKLIALALVLATSAAMIACNSTTEETTTGAPTTTPTPVVTTKKPDTDPKPETEPAGPVAETPATGLAIADIFAKGKNLQTLIDQESVALAGMTPYGDAENQTKIFNGTIKGDKLGGNLSGTAELTWKTTAPTTVNAYVVFTGNDSGSFGRLPYAWEFFGSNDDGATWTSIDKVEISGVTKTNDAPFGYTVDTPAEYTSYKFAISAVSSDGVTATVGTGALQMNEIVILGSGEGTTAETPVTDATEIDALIASGNLTANVKDPAASNIDLWNDGAATNAFDGDTTGTKLGGGGKGVVTVTWSTDVETTVTNYVIYTGGDSAKWGRTPNSWVLFGSTDGETWTIIDYVSESGMPNSDSTPYGFSVDKTAAYTQYTLCILSVLNSNGDVETPGATQFNELVLIGTAAVAETPAE